MATPNRAVLALLLTYKDSAQMSDIAGNVVLKRADGGQESLLPSDIQSISSTGTSLMPEGLETAINPAQMADLIKFLRQ